MSDGLQPTSGLTLSGLKSSTSTKPSQSILSASIEPTLTTESRPTSSKNGETTQGKTDSSPKKPKAAVTGGGAPSPSLKRTCSNSTDVQRPKPSPGTPKEELLANLVQLPFPTTGQCGTLTWSTSVEHSYRTETFGCEGPGFSAAEVLGFQQMVGGEKIDFEDWLPNLLVDPLPSSAQQCPGAVFISNTGVDDLSGPGTSAGIWEEFKPLPEPQMPPLKDKKRFSEWVKTQETHHEPSPSGGMRWDLVKEHYGGIAVCRKRLCSVAVAGLQQPPSYAEGKQRVYDLNSLQWASKVRNALSVFGPKATDLNCEGNLYWTPGEGSGHCNIPWHRDAERKLVIGTRWGDIGMYIMWAPFYEGRPVGIPICRYLHPGSLYVMSFEAAGWAPKIGGGWSAKNSKAFHWKHAAGHRIVDCLGKHEKSMKSLVRRWCEKHSKSVPDWAK